MAIKPQVMRRPTPEQYKLITEIETKCSAEMTGHGANIQGAVLLTLLAKHYAGLPPDMRDKLFTTLVEQAFAMGQHYANIIDKTRTN